MKDILLKWNAAQGVADLALKNGDIALDVKGVQSAVIAGLFSDATHPQPDELSAPRGWWGGAVGSSLWRHRRSKNTQSNALAIESSASQALAGLDAGVEITVERNQERVALRVVVNGVKNEFRGALDAI